MTNGSCLFAAGLPINIVGSQSFQTFSTRQTTHLGDWWGELTTITAWRVLSGELAFVLRSPDNVGGDRRQCSACRVFRPKAMLSRVEKDVCHYFGQQEFFQRFGRRALESNWAPVFADVVVLPGFYDRDDYRFMPYFRYLSSWDWQIKDVSEIVDGTMSERFDVEGLIPSSPMAVVDLANRNAYFVSAGVKYGVPVNVIWWNCHLSCLLESSPAIALVVVWIDGRIYWQYSSGLGWSSRRTGRPCLACIAAFWGFGP